jgi:predicted esterase
MRGALAAAVAVALVVAPWSRLDDGKSKKPVAGGAPAPFSDVTIDDDVKDVAASDLRVKGEERQRYFLIPARAKTPPASGFGLLVVMPGGTGEAGMHGFVRRIWKNAVPDDWVVAQLVSVKWKSDQQVVWPTRLTRVPEMKFTTEEYFAAVVEDLQKVQKTKVDPARLFELGWSSGGPAEYAIALQAKRLVTGSYVAMSVFPDAALASDLELAKGQAFFLDHSPEDQTCKFSEAQRAKESLAKLGAAVELVEYKGGHGWSDDPFARMKKGFAWLEKNHGKAPRR